MASGDIFDIFKAYMGTTTAIFRIQLQKVGSTYQVCISSSNNGSTWTYSPWQDLVNGWNAIEIDWLKGHDAGTYRLWIGGMLKATLTGIDNNNLTVDFVRLGAQLVDTGTRGTIYFDDFESRRFSEIGLLPDPGIQNPTPTPVPGWDNVTYTYGDPDHVHAVTALSNGSTYTYDPNGNQTCRYENSKYLGRMTTQKTAYTRSPNRLARAAGMFLPSRRKVEK